MIRETIEAKGRRLADSGAVRIIGQNEAVLVAEVAGDSGSTHRITLSTDGAFHGCSCPAVGACSHIIAATLTVENVPPSSYEGDRQMSTTHQPDPVEVSRSTDEAHVAPTAAEAAPAPLENVEAALLPLADAPVTYITLRLISRTEFVPGSLRGKPEAVLAAVLTGREMGLGPMESLRSIDVIDGRPAPSAELLSRMIRAAGHRVDILEATTEVVRIKGTRADTEETLGIEYTLGDAERAGLVEIDEDGVPRARSQAGYPLPWEKYTSDMLFARAITRLWRRLFSDVTTLAPFATKTGQG